jgi:urease accessory protein
MSGDRLLPGDVPALRPENSRAQVDLRFAAEPDGRTWLETQRAGYPFHVGRCLNMAGDPQGMATVYVQSCSGGIFEHDDLRWSISAAPGARAHVTTSASTIVHSMETGEAAQEVRVCAEAGSYLEYLPDPLIMFPGAGLSSRLHIGLDDDATVLAWDTLLAHDPQGAGPPRAFKRLRSEWTVESLDGRLLACDRCVVTGELLARALPGVNGSHRCHGSFVVLRRGTSSEKLIEAIREELPIAENVYAGVSTLPNNCGAVVRVLAMDAAALRAALHAAWKAARMLLLGAPPSARRK